MLAKLRRTVMLTWGRAIVFHVRGHAVAAGRRCAAEFALTACLYFAKNVKRMKKSQQREVRPSRGRSRRFIQHGSRRSSACAPPYVHVGLRALNCSRLPHQVWDPFTARMLCGATMGIIGFGLVGREVAKLAQVSLPAPCVCRRCHRRVSRGRGHRNGGRVVWPSLIC